MTKTSSAPLYAGAAQVDITPPIGIPLGGQLTQRISNAVHDPLHARAVVLASGETRVAFVLLDVIAITNEDAVTARKAIGEAAGLPTENVCVSCTHTHSAPEMVTLFQSHVQLPYIDGMIHRAAEAARLAAESLQPARVAWKIGWEPRAAFNRRYHMRSGGVRMNPGHQNPDILRPAGPTDPGIPLLMLEASDGTPLAVIANFSLHYIGDHPSLDISADYFGRFAAAMKQRMGEGFVALLTHGASGDINNIDTSEPCPAPENDTRSEQVAGWLADQVQSAWSEAEFVAEVPIASTQAIYQERVRKLTQSQAEKELLNSEDESLTLIERLYARERLELLHWPDQIPLVIQAIRVGDWAAATMAGEIFCRFGLDLKHASPFPVTALIELANGHAGYVPTMADYGLGGYETELARSAFAAPGTGEEMVAVAVTLLQQLLRQE